VPMLLVAAVYGGWWLILPVIAILGLLSILDALSGDNLANADPETGDDHLFWHRTITMIWLPIQVVLVFGLIGYVTTTDHLSGPEILFLFFGIGQVSGVVGIVYAHEMMHQQSPVEHWLADLLMASVLYCHYRSEHLLVHHRHVGTPRDVVTARYNENFHAAFPRILQKSLKSAFRAEAQMLRRKGLVWWDASNPFWRYLGLQTGFLLLAMIIAGWAGLALFLVQALVAIWHLEIINYIEHYGLMRKHLGGGKYEHAKAHHSWNAAHRVSNWLLINLQRHSDHHIKPSRRYPLLQHYSAADAPVLPFSYPIMFLAALIPPIWLRMMNPRVQKWRKIYYPEITDWSAYKAGSNPMPR